MGVVDNNRDFMLSLAVPVYNEAESLGPFLAEVVPVLNQLGCRYEIVFVDDGSQDGTWERIAGLAAGDERLKGMRLSRNFGKEHALTAAFDVCAGDAVIPMDVDLQDPPGLIPELVRKWREGYDVVYGVRKNRRGDSCLKRFTARWFYRLLNVTTEIQIPPDTGDFRLLDRRVLEALKLFPERNRFFKGIFAWVGFRQVGVDYERPERSRGISKWNYWRLWNFAIDGLTGFSTVPLRFWSYFGALVALAAFFYALFLVVRTVLLGVDVPGYASLMVVMLFLGGVQLVTAGIMGEYIGRIFREVKQRPVYLVRDTAGSLDGRNQDPRER